MVMQKIADIVIEDLTRKIQAGEQKSKDK